MDGILLLIDIGNTNIHFYKNGQMWNKRARLDMLGVKEKFYYICVNSNFFEHMVFFKNAINLDKYIKLSSSYNISQLGADRKVLCKSIEDGIIVSAGTAITVDVVKRSFHHGGFILPGIIKTEHTFKNISKLLEYKLDFNNIDIDVIPKSTKDALEYGIISSLVLNIENIRIKSGVSRVYLTGLDGHIFSKFIRNSVYDKTMIFNGMLKVIKEEFK